MTQWYDGPLNAKSQVCVLCNVDKPLSDFRKAKSCYLGVMRRCKSCMAAYNKPIVAAYHIRNRQRRNRQIEAWKQLNADKVRAHKRASEATRHARKLAGKPVAYIHPTRIAMRWEMFGNKCYLCGKPAQETDHVKALALGGAHLLCNMRPICRSCNAAKGARWDMSKTVQTIHRIAV